MQQGKKYTIKTKDDATFLECLATVDEMEAKNTQNTIFPINQGYIHNYMQLFINFDTNTIYEDVGIYAYAPDESGLMRKFNPIRENIKFNVYPDSYIQLQPDVGC